MSLKKDKERKRQKIRKKTSEKILRKKKRAEKKSKKDDRRFIEQARVNNLVAQSQEYQAPTFDRSAFQPGNTQHVSKKTSVLGSKKPRVGFDKDAWKPPHEEQNKSVEYIASNGFDKTAWVPPNDDS